MIILNYLRKIKKIFYMSRDIYGRENDIKFLLISIFHDVSAILEILEAATISNQPESMTACDGSVAGFSIVVYGLNTQYQWQVNDGSGFVDLMDNATYSNTNSANLNISMVDISMLVAMFAEMREGEIPAGTAELSITYLRQAQGAHIYATAQVIKRGRQLSSIEVDITDDDDKLCARGKALYAFRAN